MVPALPSTAESRSSPVLAPDREPPRWLRCFPAHRPQVAGPGSRGRGRCARSARSRKGLNPVSCGRRRGAFQPRERARRRDGTPAGAPGGAGPPPAARSWGLTGAEIARRLGLARSAVARWLARAGMGRLGRPDPPAPVRRYQRARPGELIHLDIKTLGRFDRPATVPPARAGAAATGARAGTSCMSRSMTLA